MTDVMKTTLCTLYNSLYLDKGLVLYDSLKACAKDFELYVLCMDEKCYEVLTDLGEKNLSPIPLAAVENEEMLKAKSNRTIAEYCWTCTSRLIQYILETYQPECCTYIDADMYFYHDPQLLVGELLDAGKSVMMVPHRFTSQNESEAQKVGTYCVEFNVFKNDQSGWEVLNHWHHQCLECCSNLGDGIHWGDQKYMDEWPVLFADKVHVCEHPGAGVAPWNLEWYRNYDSATNTVVYQKNEVTVPVVFYHFQSIAYFSRKKINTNVASNNPSIDYQMVEQLYEPYLRHIDKKKQLISRRFGINLLIKHHPSITQDDRFKQWVKSFKLVRKIMCYVRPSWKHLPYIIYL